ncbi:MAG TPA: hypothetical protein VIK50_13525 [Gemmatimonadaceae bacterium]
MTRRHEASTSTRRPGCLLLAGTLVASLAAGRVALASTPQRGEMCTVSAEPARRLELGDGRIVSVDVQSVATSGGSVMAVGRHAYVFPRTANPLTSPTLLDSIIGVVIDGRGNTSLVTNPVRTRHVLFPRVAAAPDSSFHVLFVTSSDSAEVQTTPLDTATIWYARFGNGAWTRPEPVASVRAGFLQSESAELLEHDGSPEFLFPFVDAGQGSSSGGVILLRWRQGVWSADTLRTRVVTPFVRALNGPDGRSLVAVIAQAIPRGGRIPADELYVVRFDSAWSEPRRIGGDGRRPVTLPILTTVGDTIVASWISWRPMRQETSRIDWLRIDPGGRVVDGPMVDAGNATFPFEMIGVDNRYPLWLYHGEPGGSTVSLVMASGSGLVRLGSIPMPFENPKPKAIALTPTRILVFTMKQGTADNEPMIASYTTALEIRCPRSAQR